MMSEDKSVVGIRFQRAGKIYYFDPAGIDLAVNDYVVVETERGPGIGRVVIAPKQVIASELAEPLKPVLRKAMPQDLQQREAVKQKEQEALAKCKELVAQFELPMRLLSAEGNLEGSHFTILFSAEGRVDFRRLVRELAATLKARVELHQVGPRDEAKIIGGVGRCGCPLCCMTFLTEFSPLSIKMAKEQNLSLDPTKISGLCGRLLCCLGYETEDDIAITGNRIEIAYGMTAPMCPYSAAIGLMIKYALEKELGVPVTINLKTGHRQEKDVAEILSDPEQSAELMRKLEEFGVLERCVRL
jgi:cell fate regulator YaaT (PSP1 superfamily)